LNTIINHFFRAMTQNKHIHEKYMQRCLQLAKNGMGYASPNPMVGSVIVHNNKIIGEGWHRKYGGPHAEVNAVRAVKNEALLKEATLYVNLEPCAHHGKTPPCSDLIIEKQIPKVVIGCVDTFSKVAGKGIEKMQKAGIEVTTGILEQESRKLNRRFFTFHEQKRPYIILKWAQTTDGFIDIADHRKEGLKGLWITNEWCRRLVHKWRAEEQGILVGTETAIKDNPKLDIRSWQGKNPTRIVLDRSLRIPKTHHLFDKSQPTIVYTEQDNEQEINLKFSQINFNQDIVPQILDDLYQKDIQSVIIEGGKQVLDSFINAGIWDEARIFSGERFFYEGTEAAKLDSQPYKVEKYGNSTCFYFKNMSTTVSVSEC